MEVKELSHLGDWIEENIVSVNIVGLYTNLFNILNQNSRRGNQPAQPFESQKNELVSALKSIDYNNLTEAQIKVLEILGLAEVIGERGSASIERLLENTLDIAHIVQSVQKMKVALEQGVQKITAIQNSLQPIQSSIPEKLSEGKVLTRVTFHNDASIHHIAELKDWSNRWFEIGRGFAIANGGRPEDVEVVGASKGSLIFELAFYAATALPIAKAINLTIDSLVKFQEFRIKAIEIRNMKDENPDLSDDLEDDAIRWEERASRIKDETVTSVVSEVKQFLDDYKKEHDNELNRAVKNLVDFISRGGDVDCLITDEDIEEERDDEDNNDGTLKILRSDFKKIREARKNLRLEHLKDE